MTYKQFHNLLRVLNSIDRHELWGDLADDQYHQFQKDPFRYFIAASDHLSRAIWDVMMERVKPRETAE